MLARWLEGVLFASRWLLAPFYLALIACLVAMLVKVGQHVQHLAVDVLGASETQVTLDVLSLIDFTLTASLVVIVIFSGYENFVSRVDPDAHKSWPEWMTQIDFAGLKLKLVSTIVAIAAIHLLKQLLQGEVVEARHLIWVALILLAFAATGVLLALGDRMAGKH